MAHLHALVLPCFVPLSQVIASDRAVVAPQELQRVQGAFSSPEELVAAATSMDASALPLRQVCSRALRWEVVLGAFAAAGNDRHFTI